MEPAEVTACAFLWDGSEEGWAVVETEIGPAIYNTRTGHALIVEDDDVHARVVDLMREHGCPRLDSLP